MLRGRSLPASCETYAVFTAAFAMSFGPSAGFSAREAFLYLVLFSTLYLSAINFGSLVFDLTMMLIALFFLLVAGQETTSQFLTLLLHRLTAEPAVLAGLRDGSVPVADVIAILRSPPTYVETAKVFDILMAVPKFGRVKAARFLNQCRISQSKTVGGLSDRQRAELVALLRR